MSTILILVVSGLSLAAYLKLASRQHAFALRSQTWASEIPIAEAGIDEALAHINHNPFKIETTGWNLVGNSMTMRRDIGEGYYYVSISSNRPPTITSVGFGRVPGTTNFTHRTVFVTTKGGTPGFAILAKKTINMVGNTSVDSFNSTDPASSTGGRYDLAKRRDHAMVATIHTNRLSITTGSGKIYGSVGTGPGGTASGSVGDVEWVTTHPGEIQPYAFQDDINVEIPGISVPFTAGVFPGPRVIDGVRYNYVLQSGDYVMNSLTLSPSQTLYVQGKARLYIRGECRTSGDMIIAPGASLELYIGGPRASIGANGIVNTTANASQCTVYGLPTLRELVYTGNATFYGRINVPNAVLTMSGTPSVVGALIVDTFVCNGNTQFHYDEALGGPSGGAYRVVTWEEL